MYPDLKTVDNHGNSVLHIAAQNGRAGVIEDLILNGADVNYGNNHENTAIHLAAQNGWNEVAGHLLRAKKLNVNKKDLHANTALHLAAQNGQLGVSFKNLFWTKKRTGHKFPILIAGCRKTYRSRGQT